MPHQSSMRILGVIEQLLGSPWMVTGAQSGGMVIVRMCPFAEFIIERVGGRRELERRTKILGLRRKTPRMKIHIHQIPPGVAGQQRYLVLYKC